MIVKYLDESLIDLRNSVNSKEIPANENPKKTFNIVENVNKQEQGKGIKILTHKQIFQRLPIALAQIKVDNTSETYQMKSEKSYILCIDKKESY